MVRIGNNRLPAECVYAAGGSGNDRGLSVTVDSNENIYVTGIFRNTATFNRHPLGRKVEFIIANFNGSIRLVEVKMNLAME